MPTQKPTPDQIGGCLLAIWHIGVVTPMWLVLLFAILHSLGDNVPVYAWVLYWAYVPATILGVCLASVVTLLRNAREAAACVAPLTREATTEKL